MRILHTHTYTEQPYDEWYNIFRWSVFLYYTYRAVIYMMAYHLITTSARQLSEKKLKLKQNWEEIVFPRDGLCSMKLSLLLSCDTNLRNIISIERGRTRSIKCQMNSFFFLIPFLLRCKLSLLKMNNFYCEM